MADVLAFRESLMAFLARSFQPIRCDLPVGSQRGPGELGGTAPPFPPVETARHARQLPSSPRRPFVPLSLHPSTDHEVLLPLSEPHPHHGGSTPPVPRIRRERQQPDNSLSGYLPDTEQILAGQPAGYMRGTCELPPARTEYSMPAQGQ